MTVLRLGRHDVEITHPDKVLFPGERITKWDLAEYYGRVAEFMLPHVRSRPVSMQRFPDGIGGVGFFQKEAPDYFPDWIATRSLEKEGGTVRHVVCRDAATLVYLAGQACITPHMWLSRSDRPHHPDLMIFDLDPSGDDFDPVREAARLVRGALEEIGLPACLKTTGSRGLHVTVPLDRSADFNTVRDTAGRLARLVAHENPRLLTIEQRKDKRRGRVFIDVLRNGWAQTAVPPYAVRALAEAPVAAPIDWEELGAAAVTPRTWTIRNIFRRLGQKGDPWKGMSRRAHSLGAARRRLAGLES